MLGKRVWSFYVTSLTTRPLVTQAVTTGIICGVGDVLAQQGVEARGREHNWKRTIKMAAIGFFFTGPVLKNWFALLDRMFGRTVSGRDAFKKMVVDQVLFAPVLFMALLPLIGISNGLKGSQLKEKVIKEYPFVLMSCYKVWPLAQMVNFYFIPLMFRVNYTNIVSLGWNTYLAWVSNRDIKHNNNK